MHGNLEAFLAESIIGPGKFQSAGLRPAFRNYPDLNYVRQWSNQYVSDLLNLSEMYNPVVMSESKLRIALHLSPPKAVFYDPKANTARWEIIYHYLENEFTFPLAITEKLARKVASILDQWDSSRNSSISHKIGYLLEKQKFKCATCHVPLKNKTRIEFEEQNALSMACDPYKPYFDGTGVETALSPVVDHINPVSRDGTNYVDNLQALCHLCNWGKSSGMGIPVAREMEFSHLDISEIPRFHRAQLLYYRLLIDSFRCAHCQTSDSELTIRKVRPSGVNALTNLVSVCNSCADKSAT